MALSINITSAVISGNRIIVRGNIEGIPAADNKSRMYILNYELKPKKGPTAHPSNAKLGIKAVNVGGVITHELEVPRYAGLGGPERLQPIQDDIASGDGNKVLLGVTLYDTVSINAIDDKKHIGITSEF